MLGWVRLEGQRRELYDFTFGTALRTVVEIAIFGVVSWWTLEVVRMRDIRSDARRVNEKPARSVCDRCSMHRRFRSWCLHR